MMKSDGWLMSPGQSSRHLKLDPLCSSQTLEEPAVGPQEEEKMIKIQVTT